MDAQCFRKPPLKANVMSSWGYRLIRATSVRAILLSIAFLGTLAPYRGFAEEGNQLPTKATKELPPQLLSLLPQRNMPKRSPILVRIFKEESELEVWKQDTTRRCMRCRDIPRRSTVQGSGARQSCAAGQQQGGQ